MTLAKRSRGKLVIMMGKTSEPSGEGDGDFDGGGGGQYYVDLLLFLLKSEFLTLILTELLTF